MPAESKARWSISPRCEVFRAVYREAESGTYASWNQIETSFLHSMSAFDTSIALTSGAEMTDDEKSELSADLQNGKGDFFNDLLVLLLRNCSGVSLGASRRRVPGLVVPVHNLDGVYPSTGEIGFMLEAKMMGTPKHINSPKQKPVGRPGSADLDKRVKELAFKSIDLKGEFSRLRTMTGEAPTSGAAGGGDLTAWLRSVKPRIYFCLAVRVVSESDFQRTLTWASTAQQVVDGVGLYCFEPVDNSYTLYRRREGVPADLQLERVLYKACLDLQSAKPGP
jgi:hypothetical protein